ncbi:hypothetical protein JCM3770_005461 [Rhodotorula araucariae]
MLSTGGTAPQASTSTSRADSPPPADGAQADAHLLDPRQGLEDSAVNVGDEFTDGRAQKEDMAGAGHDSDVKLSTDESPLDTLYTASSFSDSQSTEAQPALLPRRPVRPVKMLHRCAPRCGVAP